MRNTGDPYRALGLSHDATGAEIKRAFRKLAMTCHPDKLIRLKANDDDINKATSRFASIAAAYAILSDDVRKREYDHIYKYGGFDEVGPQENTHKSIFVSPTHQRSGSGGPASKRHNAGRDNCDTTNSTNCSDEQNQPRPRQSPQSSQGKGIGYAIDDPLTFIFSQGKVRAKTIAGVEIPSRFNLVHPAHGGGFRFCFSSGQIHKTSSGSMKFTSKTTQFAGGKTMNRSETTTFHRDGRKEVVIQGDDYIERRVSALPKRKRRPSNDARFHHRSSDDDLTRTGRDDELPWYMSAWNGMRDSISMCTTGSCGPIQVR
jgi:curved DNA-binding protein CbpA